MPLGYYLEGPYLLRGYAASVAKATVPPDVLEKDHSYGEEKDLIGYTHCTYVENAQGSHSAAT